MITATPRTPKACSKEQASLAFHGGARSTATTAVFKHIEEDKITVVLSFPISAILRTFIRLSPCLSYLVFCLKFYIAPNACFEKVICETPNCDSKWFFNIVFKPI
jgi:hypothetical protein